MSVRLEGSRVRRVAVVGGGVAGLMATLELAQLGVPVDVFSVVPVRRSHSVVAQGGVSGARSGASTDVEVKSLFEGTIRGGEDLAHRPHVLGMARAAAGIVDLFDRMGVPFHRTSEGHVDRRRLGGHLEPRAAFAGATTGQHLLYALDEQARRFEVEPLRDARGPRAAGETLVRKLERWDFIALVRDDAGVCVGLIAQDLVSMAVRAFPYDAVILATGGPGGLCGKSAYSTTSSGAAAAAVVRQGAVYANGEFIQSHPTALRAPDKWRVVSDALRGEGARLWVPTAKADARAPHEIPEKERDYFFERASAAYGNLPPADAAARAIFRLCVHEGRGVFDATTQENEHAVYLDLTNLSERHVRTRLGGVEGLEKVAGFDPFASPLKVFPAVSYSMGGLWVDYESDASGGVAETSPRNQATNIPGLYAAGEVEYQFHGASRLGGNALLACAYAGQLAARAVGAYRDAMERSALDLPKSIFDKAQKSGEDAYRELVDRKAEGGENPYVLHDELAEVMQRDCTIERDDAKLDALLGTLAEIGERAQKASSPDSATRLNAGGPLLRRLADMVVLARVITKSARQRAESRGAHFKPASPRRDDAAWLKSTLARWKDGEPEIVSGFEYACAGKTVKATSAVDTGSLAPRATGESDG